MRVEGVNLKWVVEMAWQEYDPWIQEIGLGIDVSI
jgi:hypothetical protein